MRQKKAELKSKGINLQYTETDETVYFDDVAGIGEAKVSWT